MNIHNTGFVTRLTRTGATSRERTANPSGAQEFIPEF